MKLPKRIADILKKKQDYIDSQRDRLGNTVIKLQSQLLSDILTELIPELDVKDGIIQDTAKNYRLVAVLDKTFKDFQKMSNAIVLDQIVKGTSKIQTLSASYYKVVLSDIPARFEKIVEKTNKLINLRIGLTGDKVFKGGWLDSYFNSNTIGLELKQMTSNAITSGVGLKEYTKLLRDKITGTEEYTGGLERQFKSYAYDLYQQYDAAYNLMIGNEFGFNYFIYQGGLIEDSRDFCAAHNNKVWNRDNMKTWSTWTPSEGEYPAGYEVKQKDIYAVPSYLGYAGYDPGINRGGYRCRHALGWIPEELAFSMNPELQNLILT